MLEAGVTSSVAAFHERLTGRCSPGVCGPGKHCTALFRPAKLGGVTSVAGVTTRKPKRATRWCVRTYRTWACTVPVHHRVPVGGSVRCTRVPLRPAFGRDLTRRPHADVATAT